MIPSEFVSYIDACSGNTYPSVGPDFPPASAAALYRVRERLGMPALEVGVAAACAAAAILLGGAGAFWVAPFLALYAASFLWVGALSAWEAVAP